MRFENPSFSIRRNGVAGNPGGSPEPVRRSERAVAALLELLPGHNQGTGGEGTPPRPVYWLMRILDWKRRYVTKACLLAHAYFEQEEACY